MIDLFTLILRMGQQFFEFRDIFPSLAQIKWTKVLVEIVVDEILNMRRRTLSMLK
jgi:hypothetical protein